MPQNHLQLTVFRGSDPYLEFDPGTVLFDFSTTGIPTFNSSFLFFDDFNLLLGQWDTNANITVVPVPAAVWLFGSGLIGLAGVVRRKRNRI